MGTILGNLSLILAALLSKVLISTALHFKAAQGNIGGPAAFTIVMLLLHAAWLLLLPVAVVAIGRKGGWDWISANGLLRNLLLLTGLLASVFTLQISAFAMQNPASEPPYLLGIYRLSLFVIPVLSIGAGLVLLNDGLRKAVPVFCYQWPLALMFAGSLLCAGVALMEKLRSAL